VCGRRSATPHLFSRVKRRIPESATLARFADEPVAVDWHRGPSLFADADLKITLLPKHGDADIEWVMLKQEVHLAER
jgi:hypothetical protein